MSDDNKQGGAEPTTASTGSVGEPAAWVLECDGWTPRFFKGDERQYAACIKRAQDTLSPLYRQPQPTLTDAEREAVGVALQSLKDNYMGCNQQEIDTLRSLLRRVE